MAVNIELFCCAGGMAEGFRRAGITFDLAFDFHAAHCDSYERNLGHRPVQMDVRDLLRLVRHGARPEVDLLVADPPCTPWSRAGKRLGTADERDMLGVTCDLITQLRPRRFLIGNVPGLDDGTNLSIVHRTIGALATHGYCVADYARLDAADYGVPQHRHRPFWFGHLEGPCWRVPGPTHGDPLEIAKRAATLPLDGFAAQTLRPWVTCRQALAHLSGDELGRSVKMRDRNDNGKQKGSVADRPARVVGTSNLSDGNVLAVDKHAPSLFDEPSKTIGAKSRGNGACAIALPTRHDQPVHTSDLDSPARALTTQCRAAGHATTVVLSVEPHHPPSYIDEPAMAVRAGSGGGANRALRLTERPKSKRPPSTKGPQSTRVMSLDASSTTVNARQNRGSSLLEWPWDRPATTIYSDDRLAPTGHHDNGYMSDTDAVLLSERAAAILQGFPDDGTWVFCGETKTVRWGQIGQAMPPALAEAVGRAIIEQDLATKART